jgi:hypothetical protein
MEQVTAQLLILSKARRVTTSIHGSPVDPLRRGSEVTSF